jgi:cell wall-associated NlpC family hydrolase
VAIAASPNSTALPSTDLSGLVSAIQQAVAQINSLLPALQAQLGTGAAAGASTLAGGPGQAPNQLPGQSPAQAPGSGCGCGGGAGGAMGAANIGQAPTGSAGAPSGGMLDRLTKSAKSKASTGGGANAAPEPQQEAKADKVEPAAPAGGSKGEQMVAEVKKYLGTKYVYGGASPSGFDCSGLLLYVAKKFGIDLPHKASEQAKLGTAVDKANLQPGDMVFFKTDGSGGVSHAGMYIGDGKMIHAPKTGDVVKVSSINDSYYTKAWAGARRMG